MKILSVDVGSYSIKFCVATVKKDEFLVQRLLEVPVPNAHQPLDPQMAQVVSTIANTIVDHKFTSDRLVVGLPSSMCSFRFITVPFTKKKKIEQVLPFEVEDIVPFSAQELIIDYQVITQEQGSSELFLSMVPQVNYDNYMSLFLENHLESDVVMPDSIAYSIFCEKFIPQGTDTTVLIDIGHHHSSMTFVRSGKMEYVRPIPFGYVSFSANIIAATGYTQEQVDTLVHHYAEYTLEQQQQYLEVIDRAVTQLVIEANQTLIAYKAKTKQNVGEVLISGGFGRFPYIVPTLEAEFGLKVSPITRIEGGVKSTEAVDLHVYATAIGYAARYSMASPQNYINFRRKETKVHKILDEIKTYLDAPHTKQVMRALLILFAVMVPYLIGKVFVVNMHYNQSLKDVDRLVRKVVQSNISKKQREQFLEDPEALLDFLQKSLDTESVKLSVFEKRHHSPVSILHKLAKLKPSSLKVDIPQLEFTQNRLVFTVQVAQGDATAYIQRIKSVPVFQSVEENKISDTTIEISAALKSLEEVKHE